MTPKQAIAILRPKKKNQEAVKTAWRKACKQYHPDKGGSLEQMQLVNLAYDTLKTNDFWTSSDIRRTKNDTPLTESLQKKLDNIRHIPGINIELCGTWIWITGETRSAKGFLKVNGFKFSSKKSAWYYHNDKTRSKGRGKFSLDEIRVYHGTMDLLNNTNAVVMA